jgi:cationic amino acid transporter 1
VISEMGFLVDSQEGCGKGGSWGGVKSLIRRKQVDSVRVKPRGQQLAKELSVLHLIAIGNDFALYSNLF